MANPVTTGSIKGHRRAQWKWGGEREEKRKRKMVNKRYRKIEQNKEREKEYKKPKVMEKYE